MVRGSKTFQALVMCTFVFFACKNSSQKDEKSTSGPRDASCSSKTTADCSGDCEVVGTACYPTSAYCSKFTTATTCQNISSCSWNASLETCSRVEITPDGGGTPSGCSIQTDQTSCATAGCFWTAPSGPCMETASSTCPDFLDQTSCLAQAATLNCSWDGTSCVTSTTPTTCEGITTQTLCVTPCVWSGAFCTTGGGTSGECTGLNVLQCVTKIFQCKWTGSIFGMGPCVGR